MGQYEDCIAGGTSPAICAATFGGPGGDDTDTLSLLVGSRVTDANDSTFTGILRQTPGGGFVIDAGGSPRRQRRLTSGMSIVSAAGNLVVTGSGFSIVESRQLSQSQLENFFGGGGGTAASAPSFASTQAAQTQDEAFRRAQAERDAAIAAEAAEARRRFEEEQAEIDRELRLREARLATARDLVNIRSAEAREARTLGTQISGEDPFRFLAVARGLQPPTGTTPSAAFKENLLGAAQFQTPDLTGLDSNALQSAIQKLSQSNAPQGSATLGFAHGGTLGRGGTRPGDGTVAIEVGEPINGMPNPEIVILRPDGSVEVVQKAGSAQTGGEFDLGGFPNLFQRLRQSIFPTDTDPDFAGVLRGFESGIPHVFGADRDRVRSVFGFLPAGAEQETSGGFGAFAGPVSRIFQGLREAFEFQGVPNAVPEALRLSNLIGLLPAPFKIPPTFFQSLLPAEQNALVSAYRLAGVPEEDFRHLLTAPQLSANPQRATAVG